MQKKAKFAQRHDSNRTEIQHFFSEKIPQRSKSSNLNAITGTGATAGEFFVKVFKNRKQLQIPMLCKGEWFWADKLMAAFLNQCLFLCILNNISSQVQQKRAPWRMKRWGARLLLLMNPFSRIAILPRCSYALTLKKSRLSLAPLSRSLRSFRCHSSLGFGVFEAHCSGFSVIVPEVILRFLICLWWAINSQAVLLRTLL